MVKVKICGITNLADARFCARAGADFLGFIFYKKSLRYIKPLDAKKITKRLGNSVLKVGVFVDEAPGVVKKIAHDCALDILQFHGDETPQYLEEFNDFKTIKALRIKNKLSLAQIKRYKPDYFLLDTFEKGLHGGTGKTFDWKLLKSIGKLRKRVFISGGLTPENAGLLLKKFKPFAVDVSSGVECCPGKKDLRLVKKFIEYVKKG